MSDQYQPHERRVLDESKDLLSRLGKLRVFIAGDAFEELACEDRALLMQQEMCMQNLLTVLQRRIERF